MNIAGREGRLPHQSHKLANVGSTPTPATIFGPVWCLTASIVVSKTKGVSSTLTRPAI